MTNSHLDDENTAQAQEILELKAYVNELRGLIKSLGTTSKGINSFEDWLNQTPTQSLAKHNAAIEDEVVERCAFLAKDTPLTDVPDGFVGYSWGAWEAIRNMPRKYSIPSEEPKSVKDWPYISFNDYPKDM